MNPKN